MADLQFDELLAGRCALWTPQKKVAPCNGSVHLSMEKKGIHIHRSYTKQAIKIEEAAECNETNCKVWKKRFYLLQQRNKLKRFS